MYGLFEEKNEAFNDAKILIFSPKSIVNNSSVGFIENQLTRDDTGLWIYVMPNVTLMSANDIIECWFYIEKDARIGYFASLIFKVQGESCLTF